MSLPEEIINVVRLSEVATITDSLHSTPAYSLIGYPMVRVTDVRDFYLETQASLKVSKEIYKEFTKRETPQQGDIIFTRVGSYGNSCLTLQDKNFCLGQNTALIRPHIDPHYLLFCLKTPFIKEQIESSVVGSTQKTISIKSIRDLLIPIHSKEEIASISQILSSLQSKIELNRKTNETLEEIAKALFKSWFVDFDPVRAKAEGRPTGLPAEISDLFPDSFEDSELGDIPSGWAGDIFGSFTTAKRGRMITKKDTIEGSIPVVAGGMEPAYYHNKSNVDSPVVTISASGANAGFVNLYFESIWASDCSYISKTESKFPFTCYLFLISSQKRIYDAQHGGVQPHINPGDLARIDFVNATENIFEVFEGIIRPIFAKVSSVIEESKQLENLRDALLPKLISGEIRIPDAQKMFEEVVI